MCSDVHLSSKNILYLSVGETTLIWANRLRSCRRNDFGHVRKTTSPLQAKRPASSVIYKGLEGLSCQIIAHTFTSFYMFEGVQVSCSTDDIESGSSTALKPSVVMSVPVFFEFSDN